MRVVVQPRCLHRNRIFQHPRRKRLSRQLIFHNFHILIDRKGADHLFATNEFLGEAWKLDNFLNLFGTHSGPLCLVRVRSTYVPPTMHQSCSFCPRIATLVLFDKYWPTGGSLFCAAELLVGCTFK